MITFEKKKNYCPKCHKIFTTLRSNIAKCKFCNISFDDKLNINDDWKPGEIPKKINVKSLLNRSIEKRLYLGSEDIPHLNITIPILTIGNPQLYLIKENNCFFVSDINNNKFVTYLNKRLIKTKQIKSGDKLEFGGLEYIFNDGTLFLENIEKGPEIIAENLTCRYKNNKENIFSDKSFIIKSGTIVALVGESGCGKSTLLKHIFQLANKETKNIIDSIEGEISLNEYNDKFIVAYVSQDSCLPEKVKTIELFNFYATLYKLKEKKYNVSRILSLLGLNNKKYKKTYLEHLSGGQKKRVHIGVELLRYPNLLLIDEPDANLDKKNIKTMLNYLTSLSKLGITTVITIHNRDFDYLFDDIIEF